MGWEELSGTGLLHLKRGKTGRVEYDFFLPRTHAFQNGKGLMIGDRRFLQAASKEIHATLSVEDEREVSIIVTDASDGLAHFWVNKVLRQNRLKASMDGHPLFAQVSDSGDAGGGGRSRVRGDMTGAHRIQGSCRSTQGRSNTKLELRVR